MSSGGVGGTVREHLKYGFLALAVAVGYLNYSFTMSTQIAPEDAHALVFKIAALAVLASFIFRLGLGHRAGMAGLLAFQLYLSMLVPGINPGVYLPAFPFRDIMAVIGGGFLFGLLSVGMILQSEERIERSKLWTLLSTERSSVLLGITASVAALWLGRGLAVIFSTLMPSTLGRPYFAYPAAIGIILATVLGYQAGRKLRDRNATVILVSLMIPLGALLGCAWALLCVHWLQLPPRYYFGLQLTHLVGFVVAYGLVSQNGPRHHAAYLASVVGSLGAVTHWALFLIPHRSEFLPWVGLGLLVTVACHFLVLDRQEVWDVLRRL